MCKVSTVAILLMWNSLSERSFVTTNCDKTLITSATYDGGSVFDRSLSVCLYVCLYLGKQHI